MYTYDNHTWEECLAESAKVCFPDGDLPAPPIVDETFDISVIRAEAERLGHPGTKSQLVRWIGAQS